MITGPETAYYNLYKHKVNVKKQRRNDKWCWLVEVTLFQHHRAPHRQTLKAYFFSWQSVTELIEVIRLFDETRQREDQHDQMENVAELEEAFKQARDAYSERKQERLENFISRIKHIVERQIEPEAPDG